MSFTGWIAVAGALLLTLALASAWIRRMPVSSAALYLVAGLLLGPWVAGVLVPDFSRPPPWLERVTELALVVSLFIGGLRLRLPPTHAVWRPAYLLAGPLMLATIAATAFVAWKWVGLTPGLAILVAAALAPTDPVLAGAVTVGDAADRDPLRYALSGEAGLNDGAAFPFVILGIALVIMPDDPHLVAWATRHLLWGVPVALVIGFGIGRLFGTAAIRLRARHRDTEAPTDFLALALMALSYAAAQLIGALGFLAVFAAGIGLRAAEIRTVQTDPHPEAPPANTSEHPPAETLVSPNVVKPKELEQPAVAAGVMVAEVFSFGDALARMVEVLLVVFVGASLALHWDLRGVILGLLLIVVIRPPLVMLCLVGTRLNTVQRALVGWFGIRGLGSIYYVAYAAANGLDKNSSHTAASLVLSAVATSIVVHGLSSQVLMEWYERRKSD